MVQATVPGAPELGTVSGVPVEWTDVTSEFNDDTGTYDYAYTLKSGYMTPAELQAWQDAQVEPEPEPETPPAPGGVSGASLLAFVGQDAADPELVALADQHLAAVTAMAKAYTRDRGFTADGTPKEDVAAVLMTATARLLDNPQQNQREAYGDYQVTSTPFVGWSLVELAVLNRYRVRTA